MRPILAALPLLVVGASRLIGRLAGAERHPVLHLATRNLERNPGRFEVREDGSAIDTANTAGSADAADASHAADAADDRCRPPADPLAAWHDGWRSPVAPHRTIRAGAVDLALAGTPRDAAPPASAVTGDPASRRHVLLAGQQ